MFLVDKFLIKYTRSSGAGGQNVNKGKFFPNRQNYRKKQCGGVYFSLYSITYWMPIHSSKVMFLVVVLTGLEASDNGESGLILKRKSVTLYRVTYKIVLFLFVLLIIILYGSYNVSCQFWIKFLVKSLIKIKGIILMLCLF